MWFIILIICLIYALLLVPIQQGINKLIKNKRLNLIANFLLAIILFIILYGVASMFGYSLY